MKTILLAVNIFVFASIHLLQSRDSLLLQNNLANRIAAVSYNKQTMMPSITLLLANVRVMVTMITRPSERKDKLLLTARHTS